MKYLLIPILLLAGCANQTPAQKAAVAAIEAQAVAAGAAAEGTVLAQLASGQKVNPSVIGQNAAAAAAHQATVTPIVAPPVVTGS